MPSKSHVHKYHLVNIGSKKDTKKKVYACSLPDCSHYMPNKKLVVGKKSICWKCNKEFTLDVEIIIRHPRSRPTCFSCRKGVKMKPEEAKELKKFDDALEMFAALRGDLT